MNRVLWSEAASNDLSAIRSHYLGVDEHVARAMIDRILLATDWLQHWRFAGQEIGADGWRRWKPRRTPYVLICRPIEGGIEISRIRHERENWMADL